MEETRTAEPAFVYNLSAFLSAARSVMYVMDNECDLNDAYSKWRSVKVAFMKNDEEWEYFGDLRDVAVHWAPPRPQAHYQVEVVVVNPLATGGENDRGQALGGTEGPDHDGAASASDLPVAGWAFHKYPAEDPFVLCRRQIARIEGIVRECEEKGFLPTSNGSNSRAVWLGFRPESVHEWRKSQRG